MATTIQKVTILGGSGRLGSYILRALVDDGFDVTAVTRNSSSATLPKTVKVVRVGDEYPKDQMVETFRGADAVVLSLGFGAIPKHAMLVDASIEAGVKRLIASTFGGHDGNEAVEEFFPIAVEQHAMLVDMRSKERPGWSWTSINNGLFYDFCISGGFFGFDSKEGKATVWDDGNYQFSACTRATIGKGVAGVLKHPEETANRSVFISSFEVSLNETFAAVRKAHGDTRQWELKYVNTLDMIPIGKQELAQGNMMGLGKLALASHLRSAYGANFPVDVGKLDNELLGIERENVEQVVEDALREAGQL